MILTHDQLQDLRKLLSHPGWHVLSALMRESIDDSVSVILNPRTPLDRVAELRASVNRLRQFIDMPERLTGEIQQTHSGE